MQFSKAIICLDGHSSAIARLEPTRKNIYDALRSLDIPFEEYQNPRQGFAKFREDMNQPDTLYLLADSLQYHFCDNAPCIVISRSITEVMSNPKPNCIGQLTQEMIAHSPSELVVLIARNKTMRQHFDHKEVRTILCYNEFEPRDMDTYRRNALASASWGQLAQIDYHIALAPFHSKNLACVGDILREGLSLSTHPDDLIIYLNRDICLVPEAFGILRAFMDSRNIEHCYSHRVDLKEGAEEKSRKFWDIRRNPHSWGVDLFAFRPSSPVLPHLIEMPLMVGRSDWDNYFASQVKIRLPYNISYHYFHHSEWKQESPLVRGQNRENQHAIWQVLDSRKYDVVGFEGLGPIS